MWKQIIDNYFKSLESEFLAVWAGRRGGCSWTSRPVKGVSVRTCVLDLLPSSIAYLKEKSGSSCSRWPLGENLCCMCSGGEGDLLSPLHVFTGCCLPLPLNSRVICRNAATCAFPPAAPGSQNTVSLYQNTGSSMAALGIQVCCLS